MLPGRMRFVINGLVGFIVSSVINDVTRNNSLWWIKVVDICNSDLTGLINNKK